MISRHAAWMIPVAETLLVAAWTLLLVAPVLGMRAWLRSKGRGEPAAGWAWTWDWAGLVLGHVSPPRAAPQPSRGSTRSQS